MIFVLLAKAIVVVVQVVPVKVWEAGLERLFSRFWLSEMSFSLQISLYKLFEQLIGREQNKSWYRGKSTQHSWCKGMDIITLGGSSSIKFIFATKKRVAVKATASL